MNISTLIMSESQKLLEILRIDNFDINRNLGAPKVIVICEDELVSLLEKNYHVYSSIPAVLPAMLKSIRPEFVIVQASTVKNGAWTGSSEGSILSEELVSLRNYESSKTGRVMLIRDIKEANAALYSLTKDIFPNRYFFDRLEGAPARSEIYKIVHEFSLSCDI